MNHTKKTDKLIEQLENLVVRGSSDKMTLSSLLSDIKMDSLPELIVDTDETEYLRRLVMLAVALGADEKCEEDIEKKYQTDERLYFNAYKRSGISETSIFDKFSITTSERVKKCYAILITEEIEKQSKNVPLFVQRLIKKAYKPAFTFNTHKRWSVLEEFIPWYEGKIGGTEKMSGIYLDRCFYVLLYLAYKENKIILKTDMYNVVSDHFQYLIQNPTLEDITAAEEASTEGYQNLLDRITFKKQNSEDVSFIFENIRLIEEDRLLEEADEKNISQTLKEINNMPMTRFSNALTVIMEVFGLGGDLLREAKVGNKRLEEIAKLVYIMKHNNGLTEREAEILLLVALAIYSISSEYNDLRSVFYEGLKIKIQEKEAEKERKEAEREGKFTLEKLQLQEQLKIANETISSLKVINKNHSLQIEHLEKDRKRLESQLEKTKENDKELQFLREYYFNSQNAASNKLVEIINIDDKVNYLSSIKGVIVGGHPNLTKKLKERLPSFTFVAEDEKSRNLKFIKNKDIIFISSVHDNHALFKKVVGEVSLTNVVLTYLEKYQNVDLLLDDIYTKCLEKLK